MKGRGETVHIGNASLPMDETIYSKRVITSFETMHVGSAAFGTMEKMIRLRNGSLLFRDETIYVQILGFSYGLMFDTAEA